MRTGYQHQLSALRAKLGQACGLAGDAMQRATRSLLDADLELAESVVAGQDDIAAMTYRVTETAFVLLALQAPVATDLRAVVTSLQIAADVERMGGLAAHVAKITRLRHPRHTVPDQAGGYFTEMGAVAVTLARAARDVLESPNAVRAMQISRDDDAMNVLHRRLLATVAGRRWRHGVATAVDVVLLGRFYERFADHTVQIARRVIFQATGCYDGAADAPAHDAQP